jgi:hypothetical protein
MLEKYAKMSLLDRMVAAVERVRDRLARATAALEAANVPYAVIGGNAVAVWVATVDAAAVRNTADVDILLRRPDMEAAKKALQAAGFIYQEVAGEVLFLDGPDATPRDAVHVLFAQEKVRAYYTNQTPDVTESEKPKDFRVLKLEALVRMKLTSFRRKDQVHLQDMLEIGLIDVSWKSRFSPDLADRLQQLIDTPEG